MVKVKDLLQIRISSVIYIIENENISVASFVNNV